MTYRLAFAALLLMTTGVLNAAEKYSIVRSASLIVIGTLHSYPYFPWFDGWHFVDGTIEVDEVVLGTKPPGPTAYRWTCKYSMCNDWRAPIFRGLPSMFKEKGMWCLRPLDDRTWQGSIGLGFVDLSERGDYEAHMRR
jgi:hypothetical protein